MASLFLRTVTLLVLLAMPAVTLYRAVATTTTVETDNPGDQSRQCGQKIEGQRLSSCRQYLIDSSRFGPENFQGRSIGGSWREEFPRCCDELEQMDEQCRCQAIQKVAGEQLREKEELQRREMREMKLTAQSLPGLCRISPNYCHLENASTF